MLKKKEILMKSFFNAQFNYCSLTWMLHSRRNNNIIHSKKIKFFIKDFFSKCDQIRRKLRIWSHLLKKSLMESFIFCAVIMYVIDLESEIKPLSENLFFPARMQ